MSVIIPAHNEENTICATLDSIIHSKYYAFEIIVIDDGSTDRTFINIVLRYKMYNRVTDRPSSVLKYKEIIECRSAVINDIRLTLVKKENGGKGDALNAGIAFSRGFYVTCIDADCIFHRDTLPLLIDSIHEDNTFAATGGKVLPKQGIVEYILRKRLQFSSYLQSYQDLEYGIAFNIVRPVFARTGTTMLISGAIGLFRRDIVIKLGGYASNTVGEDMELVMRIRRYASLSSEALTIGYTKDAACLTETPWQLRDLIKQRIRWTVGLTQVLWKYRCVVTRKGYTIPEKLAFLYYVLVGKYSSHIELASLVFCMKYIPFSITIGLLLITMALQTILAVAGSFKRIRAALKASKSKTLAFFKLVCLLLSFVTIYHVLQSIIRLIAVPYHYIKRMISKNNSSAWVSPERMTPGK